jgi:sensor histidine kinase YesM
MNAMQPVWEFFTNLEGFEFAAFWIASFTMIVLAGFFLDYIMQRQGFGPLMNALFVIGGIFLGLYVRFNYLRTYQTQLHDPYLTMTSIFAVTASMLLATAYVRNRTS